MFKHLIAFTLSAILFAQAFAGDIVAGSKFPITLEASYYGDKVNAGGQQKILKYIHDQFANELIVDSDQIQRKTIEANEYPCLAMGADGTCSSAIFFHTYYLKSIDGPVKYAVMVNDIEDPIICPDSNPCKITLKRITSNLTIQSKGWTASGKLSFNGGGKTVGGSNFGGGGDFTFSYSSTTTTQTGETNEVDYESQCKAGSTCIIQSVTPYITFNATSRTQANIECGSVGFNACNGNPFKDRNCGQVDDYHDKYCQNAVDGYYDTQDQLKFAVRRANGKVASWILATEISKDDNGQPVARIFDFRPINT